MNSNEGTWRDHRDELFDRVVRRGNARKRRRGLAVAATLLALVLALGAGLYLPARDDHSLRVANIDHGTTTVPARTGVLLIGDQVMLGAKSALEREIPGAQVDARPSRQLGQANAVLAEAKRRGPLPPTIIIHLGDNGPSEGDVYGKVSTQLNAIMETIGSEPQVYFVSLKLPRQWEGSINGALYGEAGRWPNTHVLAWHDYSLPHRDWFQTDGIHLTTAGDDAYAAFLRDAIRPALATFTDPFAGRPIPTSGFVLTDDGKSPGERQFTTFSMKLLDDAGNELGELPRGAIDTNVLNFVRHVLVITDYGIHLEPVPLDAASGLPRGCVPTEKVPTLAVALCGRVSGGLQILGTRILVNHGSGWSELIGLPPVPAGRRPPGGSWTWAAPSPDGRWIAAGWSGECEVPTGVFVSVADGSVHSVTGETGDAWQSGPNSSIDGWRADGLAFGSFGGEAACGTSTPAQRGIYLVSPDTGSRQLLIPLTPSQGVLRWTSVDDRRTSADVSAEASIEYAYRHFFDPVVSADERAALVEGGAGMRAFMDRSFTAHAAEAAGGAIVVDTVTVHGTTADVSFHALLYGQVSPANPGRLTGTAVLEDGRWKISRSTFCTLSANDGERCPPE